MIFMIKLTIENIAIKRNLIKIVQYYLSNINNYGQQYKYYKIL